MTDPCPAFRLTVRRGTVRAIDWNAWLADGGPSSTLIDARGRAGVAIADLTILRDDDELAPEALVRFLAGDSAGARAVIVDWAGVVGYRRVWFSDELVELPGPVEGVADTRCSGCAARFVDAEPGFWAHVRTAGRFPAMCPLCGGDLPQWRVREARPALAARDRVKPRRR